MKLWKTTMDADCDLQQDVQSPCSLRRQLWCSANAAASATATPLTIPNPQTTHTSSASVTASASPTLVTIVTLLSGATNSPSFNSSASTTPRNAASNKILKLSRAADLPQGCTNTKVLEDLMVQNKLWQCTWFLGVALYVFAAGKCRNCKKLYFTDYLGHKVCVVSHFEFYAWTLWSASRVGNQVRQIKGIAWRYVEQLMSRDKLCLPKQASDAPSIFFRV
jgi:hypothetical protein